MTSRETQAKEIQDAIRRVLLRDWDPIGVRETPEAQDEYGPVNDLTKVAEQLKQVEITLRPA